MMKVSGLLISLWLSAAVGASVVPSNPLEKRGTPGFAQGEPIDGNGKGAPILGNIETPSPNPVSRGSSLTLSAGGTNKQIDLQNPDNLGQQSTDNGVVPNVKWSFSDSKTRILTGGWVREQVITDLPSSTDISAAQQHLTKGSIRELHWHKVVRLPTVLSIPRSLG